MARYNQTQIQGSAIPSISPVRTEAKKDIDLLSKDIEKLIGGSQQINQSAYQASEYATTLAALDTDYNTKKGFEEIYNQTVGAKLSKGEQPTSSDYKNMIYWRNRYFRDVSSKVLSDDDNQNAIYKEKFYKPSLDALDKANKSDMATYQNLFKIEKGEEINKKIADAPISMNIDAVNAEVDYLSKLGVQGAREKIWKTRAQSMINNFTRIDSKTIAYHIESNTVNELLDKEFNGYIYYDKDGRLVSKDGIEDNAALSLKRAWEQSLRTARSATETDGLYSKYKYNIAKDKVLTARSNYAPVSKDDFQSMINEAEELSSNPSFTKGQSGINRYDQLRKDIREVEIYEENRQEVLGFFRDGRVVDSDKFIKSMNNNYKGKNGTIDRDTFIGIAKYETAKVESKFNNIKITDENYEKEAMDALSIMFNNKKVTGELPKSIANLKALQETTGAGGIVSNDKAFQLALYNRYMKTYGNIDDDGLSDRILTTLANQDIDDIAKNRIVNNTLVLENINNTAKATSKDNVVAINEAFEDMTDGIFVRDSLKVDGFDATAKNIYKGMTRDQIKSDMESREIYEVGSSYKALVPFADEYGLLLPKGITRAQAKLYMQRLTYSHNTIIDDSGKRVEIPDTIDEDDLSFIAESYPTGNGYDFAYKVYVNDGSGKVYELNADTINMTFAMDKEEE